MYPETKQPSMSTRMIFLQNWLRTHRGEDVERHAGNPDRGLNLRAEILCVIAAAALVAACAIETYGL